MRHRCRILLAAIVACTLAFAGGTAAADPIMDSGQPQRIVIPPHDPTALDYATARAWKLCGGCVSVAWTGRHWPGANGASFWFEVGYRSGKTCVLVVTVRNGAKGRTASGRWRC